ncbi:MAG: ribose 5-phosphate isomerase B [Mitsuokella jalaludinii]|uniref:ribose 5-phosphate isomerase B n=1 Tax=Mitsuokella jalaludinii TaxID=187979 RepID=UPI00242BBF85|nr:ribose 5-phosphate isomerase B [Mitsuokella jalaludinii]MCI6611716.1 ribose 5-phosphate isomerase B [Mitsuokella jalaludinii]MCI7063713.1 ribose 5-phosphate isomerase B [Mitsuokella jalaludinii]MCI7186323.1 ribose 5-phosphate isomerase B [Mitsuokella jalaludinii]MCI7716500.1 ribose 5-phosphate isomerase B [Mitsuokella jalaludinii]
MNITIGSDHGAVALKDEVKMVLKEYEEIKVTDVGTFGTESVDYPDIAEKVCADVTSGKADLGIVLCGTGIGISIAANKVKGIRCALCNDVYSAKKAREHNNANVLAMGGRVLGFGPAGEIVRAFVESSFEGGRHARRVNKIMAIEQQ